MAAIADYLIMAADKPSIDAIRPRLAHVVEYLMARDLAGTRCDQVDPAWIGRFRAWLAPRPIVSSKGLSRPRAQSTVENSVIQLYAAINAHGGTPARFKPVQPKEVNQTPQHRADVAGLAAMFRYCVYPDAATPALLKRRQRERAHLLAFLRISVATMARPDAAHDVSTAPERRQWNSNARVLALNPAGRRQTKKFRAVLPIAHQVAPILDECRGLLIPINSVRSAWDAMALALSLPTGGEAGMKLIRRSMAHLARQRLPQEAWGEVEIFLGHDRFDDVSDLYAPLSPTYLRRILAVVEGIIDEVDSACPGAFYRAVTADQPRVASIANGKRTTDATA